MEQMADESWELAHKVHRTVETSRTTVPTRKEDIRSIRVIYVRYIFRFFRVFRCSKRSTSSLTLTLLADFDDVFGGDVDDGTSEETDVDTDVLVGFVLHLDYIAFEAGHGATDDLHPVAFGECGEELYWELCPMEHVFEHVHIVVTDKG